MTESTCFRCGEEIEPNFDICWNCGTVLRSARAGDEPPEVVLAEVAPGDPPRRQFRLRHMFLWTTIAAVLCAVFTSTAGPFVATWLFIVGVWLSAGLFLALFLIAFVYLATSRWSPLRLYMISKQIVEAVRTDNDPRPDDGVPFDVWHQRQQLSQQHDAAPHDR